MKTFENFYTLHIASSLRLTKRVYLYSFTHFDTLPRMNYDEMNSKSVSVATLSYFDPFDDFDHHAVR